MTNVCIKFEKAEPYQTVVIDRIRLNKTDRLTDRQVQSNKPPLLQRGGIIIGMTNLENHIPLDCNTESHYPNSFADKKILALATSKAFADNGVKCNYNGTIFL